MPEFRKLSSRIHLLAVISGSLALLHAEERPYVNDQKVPESLEDLKVIQKAVHDGLPKARAATICLQIGEDGKQGSGSGVVVSFPPSLTVTASMTSPVRPWCTASVVLPLLLL